MSQRILGNLKRGLAFVISAPAGTGKTTLVRMLIDEFPEHLVESCSATTRPPRSGEVDEQHYQFLSLTEFERMRDAGEFLESAEVFGHYYGTPKQQIEKMQAQGKHVLLVIDVQGAMQIREKIDAIFIFISPPNLDELHKRLLIRKTEDAESINRRLSWAKSELKFAKEYDYHVTNENLGIAYQVLRSIVIAEEYKNSR